MTSKVMTLLSLCKCLRGELPDDPDWESILGLASQSLTTPALKDFSLKFQHSIPDDVWTYVDQMFLANERRNKRLAAQTLDAVAALNDIDVRPVLLKGAGRLMTVPAAHLGTRILWDLDILVAPEDAARAVEGLKRLGYVVRSQADDELSHWHSVLERPGEVAFVDLHTRLPGYNYFHPSIGEVQQHCQPVSCGKAFAFVTCPTVQALILIVHDQLHDADYMLGKISLLHLLDLRELSSSSDGIDWHLLGSFFPDTFLRNVLETQLVTLWALLRVDVPTQMRSRLIPRFQHWRRLQQMNRPASRDMLLAATLLLELPAFLAHRARTKGHNQGRHPSKRKIDMAPGWGRFQFLRGLAEQQKLGKIQ
jgi:hypothetical protein